MKTYKISKEDIKDLECLEVGYRALNYDLSPKQGAFRYGEKDENIVGNIYKVDGDITLCNWGLHSSKDPANVFNFYEPLGYNRYFKVKSYGKILHADDESKTVAQIIEFVEEYDILKFIKIIKEYDRSDSNAVSNSNAVINSNAVSSSNAVRGSNAVSNSNAVSWSNAVSRSEAVSSSNAVRGSNAVSSSDAVRASDAVSNSNAVINSNAVSSSNAVSRSNAVRGSDAVSWSNAVSRSNAVSNSNAVINSNAVSSSEAVSWSNAVSCSDAVSWSDAVKSSSAVTGSFAIKNCEAVKDSLFCYKKECVKYNLFNKKIEKETLFEVRSKLKSFMWTPKYDNFYDLKGNKEWYSIAFPELMVVDDKTAWSKIPTEMLEYIKSLPQFDAKIFKEITGLE